MARSPLHRASSTFPGPHPAAPAASALGAQRTPHSQTHFPPGPLRPRSPPFPHSPPGGGSRTSYTRPAAADWPRRLSRPRPPPIAAPERGQGEEGVAARELPLTATAPPTPHPSGGRLQHSLLRPGSVCVPSAGGLLLLLCCGGS